MTDFLLLLNNLLEADQAKSKVEVGLDLLSALADFRDGFDSVQMRQEFEEQLAWLFLREMNQTCTGADEAFSTFLSKFVSAVLVYEQSEAVSIQTKQDTLQGLCSFLKQARSAGESRFAECASLIATEVMIGRMAAQMIGTESLVEPVLGLANLLLQCDEVRCEVAQQLTKYGLVNELAGKGRRKEVLELFENMADSPESG